MTKTPRFATSKAAQALIAATTNVSTFPQTDPTAGGVERNAALQRYAVKVSA